ncbi:GAF domain-containing protein [Candidatus Woesearchaeota archaeon]|nr:GAF domain-containing protein [Candidatus Woesearchaeota archaeon]
MLSSHQHRNMARSMSQVLSILYETGKKINSTFDVDKILKYVVNATIKKFHYHNCSLLLVEGNSLVVKDGYGYDRKKFHNFKIPIGTGVTGRVAKSGKPLIINDISKIPFYITIVPGNKSEIAVPLKSRNRVIGVYSIESKTKNDFSKEDIRIMSAIADQLVIAIENARLYNSQASAVKRLENLYESGKTINSSLNLGTVLNTILQLAAKELDYEYTTISPIKRNRLFIKAAIGLTKEEIRSYSAKVGEGIVGGVAKTGKPAVISDVTRHPSYIPVMKHPNIISEMAVPIKYRGKVIGVFNIESNRPNAFDNDDLLFASALAEQASVAIKNAELYSKIAGFNELLKKRIALATKSLKEANEELTMLNRIKSDFVSTVSHELRTPLTSIKGYVSLVLDGDVGPVNEQQKEFLGIVNKENERLTDLISDLLDIQKIESGKMPFNFTDFSLTAFLNGYKKELVKLEKDNNAIIAILCPDNLPVIRADEDKVKQVFMNLVGNALKFSQPKPRIVLKASNERDYIQVDVRDNGIGIAKKDIPKLFQKFYQIDSQSNRKTGGTGLGLSICKYIIERHGGEIGVRSSIGKGSTFSFTLPKQRNLH